MMYQLTKTHFRVKLLNNCRFKLKMEDLLLYFVPNGCKLNFVIVFKSR